MPDATARFDADFGSSPSARRGPTRKPRQGQAKRRKGRLPALQSVARYGAIVMAAAVGIGIIANALLMQKGPHPAPLFASAPAAAADDGAPAAKAVVEPAATVSAPAAPVPARTPVVEAEATLHPATRAPAHADDPIARLIGGAAPASPHRDEKRAPDSRTIAAAQQALSKLGFPVKAGGAGATRKAVEAFEKSRHLPVKGELSHHLLRVLAAESGLHIE